ncbi:MAG: hypothetical protein KBT34_10670 [Prevotella sp.]|nr:hypothetical protein [Candidatus Prevotella equi]
MTGETFRNRLERCTSLSQTEIANILGISLQALASLWKSQDVKSGYLEKAFKIEGVNPLFLMGCEKEYQKFLDREQNSKTEEVSSKETQGDGDDITHESLTLMQLGMMNRTQKMLQKQQEQFEKQQAMYDKLLDLMGQKLEKGN